MFCKNTSHQKATIFEKRSILLFDRVLNKPLDAEIYFFTYLKKMSLGKKEDVWWPHTKLLLLHQDCNPRKYSNSIIIQIKTSNIDNLKDLKVLQSCVIQSYLVYLALIWPFHCIKRVKNQKSRLRVYKTTILEVIFVILTEEYL